LQRREAEAVMRIAFENELDQAVAEAADAVIKDDRVGGVRHEVMIQFYGRDKARGQLSTFWRLSNRMTSATVRSPYPQGRCSLVQERNRC